MFHSTFFLYSILERKIGEIIYFERFERINDRCGSYARWEACEKKNHLSADQRCWDSRYRLGTESIAVVVPPSGNFSQIVPYSPSKICSSPMSCSIFYQLCTWRILRWKVMQVKYFSIILFSAKPHKNDAISSEKMAKICYISSLAGCRPSIDSIHHALIGWYLHLRW